MATIQELKAKRDSLHDDLNAYLAKTKPKENELRDQIKAIQRELYSLEMKPVMYTLEKEISEGKYKGDLLAAKQYKLDQLKSYFAE